MVISKKKIKLKEPGNPKIDIQHELFFRFHPMCEDKQSMKFIVKNADAYKNLAASCVKLTKFHLSSDERHNTLDVPGKTAPCGYKKLAGAAEIAGYRHKFKLDRANSVLVHEEADAEGGKLLVYLGELGNFHRG